MILGQTAGELPIQGKIFAVNASNGQKAWSSTRSRTIRRAGERVGKFGGGGGWMTGSYDPALNLVFWGTANPAPDYDWGGARPGDNPTTSSVIALDPDTGQLKWYYQEIPHDDWDYDSGLGESLIMDRDGKKLLVHQNKSGFVFVLDRTNGKVHNVVADDPDLQLREEHRSQDRRADRSEPSARGGQADVHLPVDRRAGWNSGSSQSEEQALVQHRDGGLRGGCTVEKQTPVTEPAAGLFFGGDQVAKHPPGGEAHGHLTRAIR